MGLIRTQTDWMLDILSDPARTGLVAVTTPEEMPVAETLELAGQGGRRDHGAAVRRWWSTGCSPSCSAVGRRQVFEELRRPERPAALSAAVGGDVAPVLEGARLAVTMRRTRAGHLQRLRDGLDPPVPLLYLPYLFSRVHGLRTTRQVAASLGEELGF